jgi:hypothetical protein
MALSWPTKDPDAVLDYVVDWSDWLGDDTISTSTWTLPFGITKNSDSNTDTTTTIWLSGGSAKRDYSIKNRIVTADGRTDERTVDIPVRQK